MNKRSNLPTLLPITLAYLLGCSDGNPGSSDGADEEILLSDDDSPTPGVPAAIVPDDGFETATIGQSAGADPPSDLVYDDDSMEWDLPSDGSEFTGPPLDPNDGPETADECPTAVAASAPPSGDTQQVCFFSADDPGTVAARIDQVVEVVDGAEWLHVRLTLNPNFVDNSYGESAIGWGPVEEATDDEMKKGKQKGGHTFKDLVGSDHAEMKVTNGAGEVALHFKLDYISEDDTAPSGYSSQGVTGGEGKMLEGDASWIGAVATSLDRNLNACGLAEYVEDSPLPINAERPEPQEPSWDYRVVYEVWISTEAFGDDGFGEAFIEFVHASPSKAEDNSVDVVPGECPPPTNETPPTAPPTSDMPPPDEGTGGAPNTDDDNGEGGRAGSPAPVGIAR